MARCLHKLSGESESEARVEGNTSSLDNEVARIFLDKLPKEEDIVDYLNSSRTGNPSKSLGFVFSRDYLKKQLNAQKLLKPFIEEGRVKIFSPKNFMADLSKELEDFRSPFFYCKTIEFVPSHPLIKHLLLFIESKVVDFGNEAEKAHGEILSYYQSEEFTNRLKAIQKGEKKLRVYIERNCSSVCLKWFADGVAKSSKNLGHEIFIHRACQGGRVDNDAATLLEIASFKPDLFVRSCNSFWTFPSYPIENGPPIFYSMHDNFPAEQLSRYLLTNPLKQLDLVHLLPDYFEQDYFDAKVGEKQFFQRLLSVNVGSDSLDQQPQTATYDIGFVKTVSPHKDLKEFFPPSSDEELAELSIINEKFVQSFESEYFLNLEEVLESVPEKTRKEINGFYHQLFCFNFISPILNSGYKVFLGGSNWSCHEEFNPYAKGHLEDRDAYFKSFMDVKINLSINPNTAYHPRIFEGGWYGAFFLVFQPPEKNNLIKFPEGLIAKKHLDFFRTKAELQEKCEFYLKRPDLRKEMGQNLQEFVRSNYSYDAFCKQLYDKYYKLISEYKPQSGSGPLS
ncbi:MAG: hypothetical protein ACI8RA_001327 [Chlamydiales bacterium]